MMMYSQTSTEILKAENRLSPIRRGTGEDQAEPTGKGSDKGNQPNVQIVTLPLSDESDISYTLSSRFYLCKGREYWI